MNRTLLFVSLLSLGAAAPALAEDLLEIEGTYAEPRDQLPGQNAAEAREETLAQADPLPSEDSPSVAAETQAFSALDSNDDGLLDRDEASLAGLDADFDAIDVDADDHLSQTEVDAAGVLTETVPESATEAPQG